MRGTRRTAERRQQRIAAASNGRLGAGDGYGGADDVSADCPNILAEIRTSPEGLAAGLVHFDLLLSGQHVDSDVLQRTRQAGCL
ncbi:hypothetical protein D3C78_1607940 [compost metagenome]